MDWKSGAVEQPAGVLCRERWKLNIPNSTSYYRPMKIWRFSQLMSRSESKPPRGAIFDPSFVEIWTFLERATLRPPSMHGHAAATMGLEASLEPWPFHFRPLAFWPASLRQLTWLDEVLSDHNTVFTAIPSARGPLGKGWPSPVPGSCHAPRLQQRATTGAQG